MPIYMTHPKHGATHVHSGQVEAHQENGWSLADYPTYGKREPEKPVESVSLDGDQHIELMKGIIKDAAITPAKAKPGRKPKAK